MANTCASLMKLGPRDAIRAVNFRARIRWASSDTNRGGPTRIHRLRSRRNATRKGNSRNHTTKIRRIIIVDERFLAAVREKRDGYGDKALPRENFPASSKHLKNRRCWEIFPRKGFVPITVPFFPAPRLKMRLQLQFPDRLLQ